MTENLRQTDSSSARSEGDNIGFLEIVRSHEPLFVQVGASVDEDPVILRKADIEALELEGGK